MFFPYFIYKYYTILKNYSNPTKNEADVKYMPPAGADVVNSALCVASVITPLCDTVNIG
jgi:hypothetical protein